MKNQIEKFLSEDYIIFYYPNGSSYQGEFLNEKRDMMIKNGFGIQKWADGSSYVGFWKKDLANGYGVLKFKNGDVYEGQF